MKDYCAKHQHPEIRIYSGPGASSECLRHTKHTLQALVGKYYQIVELTPEALRTTNWQENTHLLVFPGGADIPYCQQLNGAGNQLISEYVQEGGSYLGICAGSYYAGNYVAFARGTAIEVLGERELAFFPGTVCGPLLASYDYFCLRGARAAQVLWQEGSFEEHCLFYNGGGYFVAAQEAPNTTVLATYSLEKTYPAIIECRVGSGLAILSGLHFEYDPALLDAANPYYAPLLPDLLRANEKRLKMASHILARLISQKRKRCAHSVVIA